MREASRDFDPEAEMAKLRAERLEQACRVCDRDAHDQKRVSGHDRNDRWERYIRLGLVASTVANHEKDTEGKKPTV